MGSDMRRRCVRIAVKKAQELAQTAGWQWRNSWSHQQVGKGQPTEVGARRDAHRDGLPRRRLAAGAARLPRLQSADSRPSARWSRSGVSRTERRASTPATACSARSRMPSASGGSSDPTGRSRTPMLRIGRLHWALDVSMDEDRARNRKGNGAACLAVVRRLALNVARMHPRQAIHPPQVPARAAKAGVPRRHDPPHPQVGVAPDLKCDCPGKSARAIAFGNLWWVMWPNSPRPGPISPPKRPKWV